METMAWFVGTVVMLPAFGIAAWLRFAIDPVDDDLLALMHSEPAHRLH